eukprot:3569133-Ditylum_brightwellii.AAC.1
MLADKTNKYAAKASSSFLTHFKATLYYDICYLKPVRYVLGQCFFVDQECKEIEQEAIQVFMLRTGFNRNMAKVIRDGPIELSGAAMTHLIDVQ